MAAPSDIEQSFIEDCFTSEKTCLIYADWLEEQGREEEAAFLRSSAGNEDAAYSDRYGRGYGDERGDGCGGGYKHEDEDRNRYGDRCEYKYGDGYGYGDGDGDGYGYGDGYRYGDGYKHSED